MKFIIITIVAICLFSCNFNKKTNPETVQIDFEEYTDNYLNKKFLLDPMSGSRMGFPQYNNILRSYTQSYLDSIVLLSKKELDTLDMINYFSLNDNEKIDYGIIKSDLEQSIFWIAKLENHKWNPGIYYIGELFSTALKNELPFKDRIKSLNQRLDSVPKFYEVAKTNLTNPSIDFLNLAITQIPNTIIDLEKEVNDSLANNEITKELENELKNNLSLSKAVIFNYIDFLKEIKKSGAAKEDFRLGEELYNERFKVFISNAITAKEHHEITQTELIATQQKMLEITTSLWPKYFPNTKQPNELLAIHKMIKKLSTQHATIDTFLDGLKSQIPLLTEFVNHNKLIYQDPKLPVTIEEAPKSKQEVSFSIFYKFGSFDTRSFQIYFVQPLNQFPKKTAESYLKEYNDYTSQLMMMTLIPGSHTQAIYSNKSRSKFKNIIRNIPMEKGWAAYAQQLMIENGYGEDGKRTELELFYLKLKLKYISNYIVDYNVHVKGWTEKEVTDFLTNQAFQVPVEAESKYQLIKLSSLEQIGTFYGLNVILELRAEMQLQYDEFFNLNSFNETFLSYGNAPIRLIRLLMIENYYEQ